MAHQEPLHRLPARSPALLPVRHASQHTDFIDHPCADDAPVTYNMVCYKCGTDISCAIAAEDTNKINIEELQQSFKDQCTGNNQLRSCAGQLCAGELAAYVTTTGCFPYSGAAGALRASPCLAHSPPLIASLARPISTMHTP